MAAWIESEGLTPVRWKPQDLATNSHVTTGVSRIQDEAPTSCASGGPRTVQSLEQVPGNPCCDTSGKLLLKGFNSHTGWATLLKRYYAFRSPRCLVGMQTLLHRVWEGTRDAGCIANSSWVIFNFIYF